jgi:hypothetical protein
MYETLDGHSLFRDIQLKMYAFPSNKEHSVRYKLVIGTADGPEDPMVFTSGTECAEHLSAYILRMEKILKEYTEGLNNIKYGAEGK